MTTAKGAQLPADRPAEGVGVKLFIPRPPAQSTLERAGEVGEDVAGENQADRSTGSGMSGDPRYKVLKRSADFPRDFEIVTEIVNDGVYVVRVLNKVETYHISQARLESAIDRHEVEALDAQIIQDDG